MSGSVVVLALVVYATKSRPVAGSLAIVGSEMARKPPVMPGTGDRSQPTLNSVAAFTGVSKVCPWSVDFATQTAPGSPFVSPL